MGAAPGGHSNAMAFIRTAVRLGLAKKLLDFARKPENQARAKALLAQAQAKARSRKTRGV